MSTMKLRQAVELMQAGQKEEARQITASILKQEPGNAQAWAIMAQLADSDEQTRYCLEQVLELSSNQRMRQWAEDQLGKLKEAGPEQPPKETSWPSSGEPEPELREYRQEPEPEPVSPMELETLSAAFTQGDLPEDPLPQTQPEDASQKPEKAKKQKRDRKRRVSPLALIGGIIAIVIVTVVGWYMLQQPAIQLPGSQADPGPADQATPAAVEESGEAVDAAPAEVDERNRLVNPGFEGVARPVIFDEVLVFEGWQPFYCSPPYTDEDCSALAPCSPGQTQGCNPPELKMVRPVFRITELSDRKRQGQSAQQWYCLYGACEAGVYQIINTQPGEVCEVGAYVQSWSNYEGDLASELVTPDDQLNSVWQIRVDLEGGTNAFSNDLLVSDAFGFEQGIYDQFVEISYTFTATGNRATVFFLDSRLWPIRNNDSYIDDAWVYCE